MEEEKKSTASGGEAMAYNAVKTGNISGKNEFVFTVKELSGGLCERQFELSDSQARELKNMVFDDGFLKTAGGRVLGITAKSKDLDTAISDAYSAVKNINFTDVHYRKDIGIK